MRGKIKEEQRDIAKIFAEYYKTNIDYIARLTNERTPYPRSKGVK